MDAILFVSARHETKDVRIEANAVKFMVCPSADSLFSP
jgi:hypothetical protein